MPPRLPCLLFAAIVACAGPSPVFAQDAAATPEAAEAETWPSRATSSEDAPDEAAFDRDGASPAPSFESKRTVIFLAPTLGFHATRVRRQSDGGISLMGPSLGLEAYVGRRFGVALRGELTLPMHGVNFGAGEREGINLDIYAHRLAGSGMLLGAMRFPFLGRFAVLGGLGLHVQSFSVRGSAYTPVTLTSLGLGMLARVDYRLTRLFSIGGEVALGLDSYTREEYVNDASLVTSTSISVSAGITLD